MHKYLHILKTLGKSIFWRIIHHLHLRKSTDSISVISLFSFPLKNDNTFTKDLFSLLKTVNKVLQI